MTEITTHNVLAVHAVLARQADSISSALRDADWMRDIPRCADDPISRDAKTIFQTKIIAILDVHQAHLDEIREAANRLREAALQYGYTDDDVAAALTART